jgi:cell division septation protein DedD
VDALVKERLTGAIILVGLVVVLVPELLSGPIRPAARARGPASSAEEAPLRSYTINLADESHGGTSSLEMQPASAPSPSAPAVEPAAQPSKPQPAPAATRAPRSEPVAPPRPAPSTPAPATPAPHTAATPPPPAASPAAASGTGAYVVQLGSFASRANADRLAKQVHELGYPVSVSRGSTGRRLYRVLVGPARDHASAEQMAAKLRAQGHAGAVVPK